MGSEQGAAAGVLVVRSSLRASRDGDFSQAGKMTQPEALTQRAPLRYVPPDATPCNRNFL